MIPKEAIEAAAKAMVALAGYDWNNMDAPGDVVADFKEQSMAQAESILEAAAPYLHREWVDTNKETK